MKKLSCLILLACSLLAGTGNYTVIADSPDIAPYFEEDSRRVGFKTIKEAVKDFEDQCNCQVKLLTEIPDIPFTHEFGAFYGNQEGSVKNLLEIRFVHRKMRENIFKIEIRTDRLDYEGEEHTLQDGSIGIYFENQIFNFFVFEKNNLQYSIAIGKKAAKIETPEALIDIANSIK